MKNIIKKDIKQKYSNTLGVKKERIIIELISGSIIINIKIIKQIHNNNQNTRLYTFILIVFLFLYKKNDIINIFNKTKKNIIIIFNKTKKNIINIIDIFNKKDKDKHKPLG